MEEQRAPDGRFSDSFLKEFFQLQSDVKRLKEHEENDSKTYERWHQETIDRLFALEKLRPELSNGRLKDLEARPIIVQLTEKQIRALFDEWGKAWGEAFAGRLSFRFLLSVAGALGVILTAIVTAAILAYLKFSKGG
jgi:hypothetical protein